MRGVSYVSKRWIKKEGRAVDNIQGANYITNTYCVEFYNENNKAAVQTGIQICANGNVVITEPLSFDSMDSKNMGNILKEPLSCMITKWNWNEPLTKAEVRNFCDNLNIINNSKVPRDKRAIREIRNEYLNMKKTLYVEGHKDYPYMNKKDLSVAVTCMLALKFLAIIRNLDFNLDNISDEEIIKTIIEYECIGDFVEKWGKQDLIDTINYLVEKNNETMIKNRGWLGWLKHNYSLAIKAYEVKNVYYK